MSDTDDELASRRLGERRVWTVDGVDVLLAGGTLDEALAADDEFVLRLAAERAAAERAAADRVEKRRLDLIEQRMRVAARAERLRRRKERESRG